MSPVTEKVWLGRRQLGEILNVRNPLFVHVRRSILRWFASQGRVLVTGSQRIRFGVME